MDIKEIERKEPRLTNIFYEAEKAEGTYWERNKYWYKKLKPKMLELVGFYAENQELRASEIYDKVYFYCIKLMKL
jgi:hypothetical protein